MYCRQCGMQNNDTAKFCRSCGCQLKNENSNNNMVPKNKKKKIIPVVGILIILIAVLIVGYVGMQGKRGIVSRSKDIEKFLENEIYTKYTIPSEEVEATYYCQTYGHQAGDGYSTTVISNFYDNVENQILASNIYDYNGDEIEDLFLVTVQDKGQGSIGKFYIDYTLYIFDEEGNAVFAGYHTQNLEARNSKRTFAFVDDKLIEFEHYDYSMNSEGDYENRINYAVSDDISWHTASLSVYAYNSDYGELETLLDFTRFNHPTDVVTFGEGFDYFVTETDAVNELYTQLSNLGINGIEIPVSSSWENRWDDMFFISNETEYSAISFDAEASLGEEDFGIGEIETQSDGSMALRTSTGSIKFKYYEAEKKPPLENDTVDAESN